VSHAATSVIPGRNMSDHVLPFHGVKKKPTQRYIPLEEKEASYEEKMCGSLDIV
jgi:hypothetical protein